MLWLHVGFFKITLEQKATESQQWCYWTIMKQNRTIKKSHKSTLRTSNVLLLVSELMRRMGSVSYGPWVWQCFEDWHSLRNLKRKSTLIENSPMGDPPMLKLVSLRTMVERERERMCVCGCALISFREKLTWGFPLPPLCKEVLSCITSKFGNENEKSVLTSVRIIDCWLPILTTWF